MKQKQNLNILFISNLSGNNFAWHFLNYAKIYSFEQLTLETENNVLTIEKLNKTKPEFNAVVCLKEITEKQCNEIINLISAKTQVITNVLSCYLMFKQKKANVIFITVKENLSQPALKLNLTCTEELCDIFNENTFIKVDKLLINTYLSQTIINACIGGESCLNKNGVKGILFNLPKQKRIIKLISESIMLTNSVMLTVEKFNNFNFYKFLSGKGFCNKIKRHFKIFALLFNLRKQIFNKQEVKENLTCLVKLNFNKHVETKNLNKLCEQISC